MGWERKRGKLEELNALLRGSTTTSILTTERPASTPPPDVRYVVTLDADTRLPRGAVGRLVGTIAHPLNRPTFDVQAGRVTQGYGVLQPRITRRCRPNKEGRSSSGSSPDRRDRPVCLRGLRRLPGPVPGGKLHGQGDLRRRRVPRSDDRPRAREHAAEPRPVRGRLRARRVGHRHRAVRRVPANYLVSASRQHRWARGDWQLLPWILGHARDTVGRRGRSALPASPAGRWSTTSAGPCPPH